MNEEARLVRNDVIKHLLAGVVGFVVGVKVYSKLQLLSRRKK